MRPPEERRAPQSGGPGPSPSRAAREHGAEPRAAETTGVHRCDLCGGEMLERHCRLVCLACGYQRDCSDP